MNTTAQKLETLLCRIPTPRLKELRVRFEALTDDGTEGKEVRHPWVSEAGKRITTLGAAIEAASVLRDPVVFDNASVRNVCERVLRDFCRIFTNNKETNHG